MRVPLMRMPVAPGRNLAILVEIAARNQLLKSRGHHSAQELAERSKRRSRAGGSRHDADDDEDDELRDPGRNRSEAGRARSRARILHRAHRPVRAREDRRRYARSRTSASSASTTCRPRSSRRWRAVGARRRHREGRHRRRRPRGRLPVVVPESIPRGSQEDAGLEVLIFLEATTTRWSGASARRGGRTRWRPTVGQRRHSRRAGARDRSATWPTRSWIPPDMTVHELRHFFMGLSRGRSGRRGRHAAQLRLQVRRAVDADLLFDVRCLPNPHFVPTLKRAHGPGRAVDDSSSSATSRPGSS